MSIRPLPRREAPTFKTYVPVVKAAVPSGSLRTYGTYWDKMVEHWGDRRLDEINPEDIDSLLQILSSQRVHRRNGREGHGTTGNCISAMRRLYRHAVADGYISKADDPAQKVAKPSRLPSTRCALSRDRLAKIADTVAKTGNDPALDALIIRLHIETACRTGSALRLRRRDLDTEEMTVLLRESDVPDRRQPVSPTLMTHLVAHADQRKAIDPDAQLFRYANGKPITDRRYNYIWKRLGSHLSWVYQENVSADSIHHTVLTWVQDHFGEAAAAKFAGRKTKFSKAQTISTYTMSDIAEVATITSKLTDEPHPLAISQSP